MRRLVYSLLGSALPVLGLMASPAHGAILSYEPFSGYAPGSLGGQPISGSGYGAGETWSAGGTVDSNAAGLSRPPLVNGGGAATTASGGFNQILGALDTSAGGPFSAAGLVDGGMIGAGGASGTLYLSFLVRSNATDLPDGSNDFMGVQFYKDGSEVQGFGNNWNAWAFSIFGRTGDRDMNSANPAVGQSYQFVDNATHLVVARIQFNANANDDVTVWLDPDPLLDEASQAAALTTSFANVGDLSFNRIALRSGSNNNNNSTTFDEIRLATTFGEAVPVPEPASLAMLAAAGSLLLRTRRRSA